MSLTTEQFDAICDAQDLDPQLAELSADEAAAKLKADGHEAFADWQPEGAEAPAKPAAKSAPIEPILEEDDRTPDLNAGAPQALTEEAPAKPEPKPATTTAVATREPEQRHEVARPAGGTCGIKGLERLGVEDFVIPQLKIKQGQTTDKDESGIQDVPDGHLFLTSDPDDHSEERTIVVLDVQPGRSFMAPYNDAEKRYSVLERLGLEDVVSDDAKVFCSSNDRQLPVARDWGALSAKCEGCPHAEWRKVGGNKAVKDCNENYRLVVVDITNDEVPASLFITQRSGIRPTQSLLTALTFAAGRENDKRKRLIENGEDWPEVGSFSFSVQFSSRPKKGKDGNYYHIPRFGRPKLLDAADAEHFESMQQQFVKTEQQAGA